MNKINQIKALLGMEVKLETMKLVNGTEIEAEVFEAGAEVFIVSEEEKVALPIGEYELEGGQVLVVAEEGVISEIKDAAQERRSTCRRRSRGARNGSRSCNTKKGC